MGWKNLPGWIKGGMIILLINIILLIILFIFDSRCFNYNSCENINSSYINIIFSFSFLIIQILIFDNGTNFIRTLFAVLLSFLVSFYIGAVIGYIIEKTTSKNKIYRNSVK